MKIIEQSSYNPESIHMIQAIFFFQRSFKMTWIQDTKDKRSWVQRLAANVLKCGPVPKHVAFIMDGNRRFAKKNSMDRAEGHLKGFDKLAEVTFIFIIFIHF